MAIKNYSDVEVKGRISSTKQGSMIGVVSDAIVEGATATGYNAGDTVMYNNTLYTVVSGKWQKTELGNASSIVVDTVLDTGSTNPVQNKAIAAVVPSQASPSNQLADKNWVNSSIATNTAYFKGTFDVVSDLGLTTSATEAQISAKLATMSLSPTNNDYVFISFDLSVDAGNIDRYDRYKYDGSAWAFEYSLNNSSFTADQWAAINSGMTSALKDTLANNASIWSAKQEQIIAGTGLALASDQKTVNHSNAVTASPSGVGSATAIPTVKFDAQGHVTGVTTNTVYPPTTAGTVGQVWTSQGAGVGKWSDTQKGSATRPIYISSTGVITEGTQIGNAGYKGVDTSISASSTDSNVPTSKAVYTAVDAKQDKLTFDNTPTQNSTNPVTSGGVFTAINAKQDAMNTAIITVPASGGTVSVTGMTATAVVWVAPNPSSADVYATAGCRCTAQANGSLTFTVEETATESMNVYIAWTEPVQNVVTLTGSNTSAGVKMTNSNGDIIYQGVLPHTVEVVSGTYHFESNDSSYTISPTEQNISSDTTITFTHTEVPQTQTLTANVTMDIGYHIYLYNVTTGDSYFLGDFSGDTITGTIEATVGDTIGVGDSIDNLSYSAVWDGTNPLNISA